MTALTNAEVLLIQKALRVKGYFGADDKPLDLDGLWGRNTSYAVRAFKRSVGLMDRDYVGPITWAKLTAGGGSGIKNKIPAVADNPPWYNELLSHIGQHEANDNTELKAWLASDGETVGDPAQIPWCGDAMQTSMHLVLPDEPLPDNPYLAANWATFGEYVPPQRGAVLSFWRGFPTNWQGHVGYYAGESRDNFYVLGGNQSNMVSIAPIAKNRLRSRGSRWPTTATFLPTEPPRIVMMTGGTVSTNEA